MAEADVLAGGVMTGGTVITGADGASFFLRPLAILAVLSLAAVLFYRKGKKSFLYAMFVLDILGVDALTKIWTVANLQQGKYVEFIPKLLNLTCVHNYGAAWSSFSGMRWFLVIITTVGLGALCYLLWRVVRHPLGVWSLLAVIGGGIGNLLNRLFLGYVIDMIDLAFMNFPVFNVADMFVVCGTILAALYYLLFYEKCDAENWSKNDENDSSPAN